MRILHCLRAPIGGLFRHVLDLSASQAERGHEVGVLMDASTCNDLTSRKLSAIADHLRLGVHKVAMTRLPGLGDISASVEVYKRARDLSIDILHGHGAKGGVYARLASVALRTKGKNVRCFYTPHGGSLHYSWNSPAGAVFLSAERALQIATDGLVFESAYAKRIYGERIGLGKVPVQVIPNGVGPADFESISTTTSAADFVFVGELRHLKGVDVLIYALAKIAAQRTVTAVIVGAGPDQDIFKEQAAAKGLQSIISFPGAMPAREAFALGRCLVVPSRAESLPYIVLEAAAAHMPVIATDVGGIPEIVNGTDISLVKAGSVEALVAAMRAFLDMPDLASRQASQLRAAVSNRFTVSAMTGSVLDFYQQLRIA